MNRFMDSAVAEALKGIKKDSGGPFGAVIVRKGKIIARGHNEVVRDNDPTAHAEIIAIRKACAKLKTFDLSDCEIYSSCKPCPMCLSAIHWAGIRKAYYGCSSKDAQKEGFDDQLLYDFLRGVSGRKLIILKQLDRDGCLKPFRVWESKKDKIVY